MEAGSMVTVGAVRGRQAQAEVRRAVKLVGSGSRCGVWAAR